MSLQVEEKLSSEMLSLLLSGVLDYSTIKEFENHTGQLEGISKLIIDFMEIRFIDSTGIYAIAQVVTRCRDTGVAVIVQNISKPIYEILEVLGLISVFGSEVFSVSEEI